MINIQELRIGNLVLYKDKIEEINNIIGDYNGVNMHMDYLDYIYISDLKPIPLTEEILLKCRFKHETMFIIKNLYLIEYGDFYFVLDENNGYYHVKLSNHSFGHEKQVGLGVIKYLHQLQNLYFALTNQELNIEL